MRPLNLSETLDAAVKIVTERWKTLAVVMLVIAVPFEVASAIIIKVTTNTYEVGSMFSSAADSKTTYSSSSAHATGQVAILALTFLSYLLGTVACYRAVADTFLGKPTSARASLAFAADRLGATLWLTIVLIAGICAGFVALIVPGIWLAVAWSVAYPAMLVEGPGGVGALKRSLHLVDRRWWATCGRLAVAYILVFVVTGVASTVLLLPSGPLLGDTSTGAMLLERAASLVASVLTTPFLAAVTTLVYFDLRARKEGFGPDAPPAPPTPFAPPAPPTPDDPNATARDAFGTGWAPPVPPRD